MPREKSHPNQILRTFSDNDSRVGFSVPDTVRKLDKFGRPALEHAFGRNSGPFIAGHCPKNPRLHVAVRETSRVDQQVCAPSLEKSGVFNDCIGRYKQRKGLAQTGNIKVFGIKKPDFPSCEVELNAVMAQAI